MKFIKTRTLLLFLLSAAMVSACKDDNDLNLNLSQVNSLISPADNVSVTLNPAQNMSIEFQWDQARAEDGSLVLYEVAFDQEGGDFADPFYTTVSNGKGVENRLSLSHSELNKIAALGGADFFEKKKFIWTVLAAKGSNIKRASQSRVIELERPGGFDVLPVQLFITGSATEGGTDVSAALPMKQIDDGTFEVYTKLKPGSYQFVDALSASANTFYILDEDGIKTVGGNGSTEYQGEEKTYRLRIDFNALSAQIHEVKSVGFWYSWENEIWFELDYDGAGVWKADNINVNLTAVDWGFEERHKYRVVLNDGTNDFEEWWGYVSNDSPGQDGRYGVDDPEYFYAYKIENNDQWNYAWKLDRPAVNGKVVDFFLKFKGDEPYAMDYIVN